MRLKNYIRTWIKSLSLSKMIPAILFAISHKQQHGFLLLLLIISSYPLFSQDVIISGEGRVLVNDPRKTKLQYEFEAEQIAKENALDKEFGTMLRSNYERLTVTEMQGRSVAFNSDIRSNYISSYPNGEWIKDKSKNCTEEKDEKGNYWLICYVTGYARKIESAAVGFESFLLDGTDPKLNKTTTFVDGEKGYLYFKSPENGYLTVFYDDFNEVQCLIPYSKSKEKSLKVEANHEYILFSQVEDLTFYTEMPSDFNLVYVLFSPNQIDGYNYNPPENLKGGYFKSKSMSRENFQEWFQKNRIRNNLLQVQIIGVSITRTP
jgi:hypothetical protein